MAKLWNEKLSDLSSKLDDLSKKAADAADDAKAYHELLQDAIDEKLRTVKGNVAAMQENARLAQEEHQSKIRSEILKIRMTVKAKAEDLKDVRDRKRLENFIDNRINYILDCYDAAALLIVDAEMSILEAAKALKEYDERFGSDAEPEALPDASTEAYAGSAARLFVDLRRQPRGMFRRYYTRPIELYAQRYQTAVYTGNNRRREYALSRTGKT